jgi:uncharacterized membrane protein
VTWGIGFRIRQYVKGSLWLLPLAGGVVGLLLAEVSLRLDANLAVPTEWQYSAATATAVLSAIIGAVAALTGFVVTVAVLVVQMATGTFSARYMRLWYRDRLLKGLLAVLIGTLLFAFRTIRQVEVNAVPDISVTLAGMAMAFGLLLFVVFLDRILHRMRPVAVAALVASQARRAFEDASRESSRPETAFVARGAERPGSAATFMVHAPRAGSIQAIDLRGLVRFARRHRCLVVLRHAVGDFVPARATLLEIHGAQAPVAASARLSGMVALGVERTVEQDPAFAIRIMVDIADKALSAAVNDPTTAVQVLDHLAETLRMIGTVSLIDDQAAGSRLEVGVRLPVRQWPDYLSLAVTEIREYGATSIQVARRLRAMLEELQELVLPDHRDAVLDELHRLDAEVAASFGGRIDLDRAQTADVQGIGGPTRLPGVTGTTA